MRFTPESIADDVSITAKGGRGPGSTCLGSNVSCPLGRGRVRVVVQRSPEEAKEALLDAALKLFIEQLDTENAISAAMNAVKFPEVAERAGYRGPGMIYHLWGDEEGGRKAARRNFQRDLMIRILDQATYTPGVDPEVALALVAEGLTGNVLIHAMSSAAWEAMKGRKQKLLYDLLMLFRHDPNVREIFAPVEESEIRELAAAVDLLVTSIGMRFRGGMTALHLTMLLRGMVDGLTALGELCPDIVDLDDVEGWGGVIDSPAEGPWSLYSVAVDSLLRSFLEPDE